MRDWITFLVTGPEDCLERFCDIAQVELFDRRHQTIRCRAHGEDGGKAAYDLAVTAAKEANVTVQDLVHKGEGAHKTTMELGGGAKVIIQECAEEWPIVHLATHGMMWPPDQKRHA